MRLNLIPNPRAAVDASGWAELYGGGGSVARSTLQAYNGPASFLVTPSSLHSLAGIFRTSAADGSEMQNGLVYAGRMFVRLKGAPAGNYRTWLAGIDAGVGGISSGFQACSSSGWTEFAVAGFTQTAQTRPYIALQKESGANWLVAEDFYFDALLMEPVSNVGDSPGTYFDGSFAGARWVGTADASVSEYPSEVRTREKPPLRLSWDLKTPAGNHFRWGKDEPDPANVPSGESFGDAMPGGFDTAEVTLPRKPGIHYSDLERFSTLRALGPGGDVAWEGRLVRAPRISGEQMAISPAAEGWQAALEDDKTIRLLMVDRDLSHWEQMSRERRRVLLSIARQPFDPEVRSDPANAIPAVSATIEGPIPVGGSGGAEAWYDAGFVGAIGSIYYDFTTSGPDPAVANWSWQIYVAGASEATGTNLTGDLSTAATGSGTAILSAADQLTTRFLMLELFFNVAGLTAGTQYTIFWRRLAVFGVGATKVGTAPDQGVLASDVIAYGLSRFVPQLDFTTGDDGTITASDFVLPQAAYLDPTSMADIVKDVNRVHLRDWAVWEKRRFYYHARGARGRTWLARVGPSGLEETGESSERLWNGIAVRFQDVSGKTFMVGPTGSGAAAESARLLDSDESNPANILGIKRRALLEMKGVSTSAVAIEVGARFLTEAKQLDRSGQAVLTGHVMDDRGLLHPYWRVRSGDQIIFTDAADKSPRRIVRANKTPDSASVSIDLDAPPEGLDALLERLDVSLVGVIS